MSACGGTYGKTCSQHNHIVFLVHGQALVPALTQLLLLLHLSSHCRCCCAALNQRWRLLIVSLSLRSVKESLYFLGPCHSTEATVPRLVFWKGFRRLSPSTSTTLGAGRIFVSPEKYGAGLVRGRCFVQRRIHAREPRAPRPVLPRPAHSRTTPWEKKQGPVVCLCS